jgi:hypothetical protein
MTAAGRRAVLLSAYGTSDEAVRDVMGYQRTYPGRDFEIELRDDGRDRPWRVTLTLRRRGPVAVRVVSHLGPRRADGWAGRMSVPAGTARFPSRPWARR